MESMAFLFLKFFNYLKYLSLLAPLAPFLFADGDSCILSHVFLEKQFLLLNILRNLAAEIYKQIRFGRGDWQLWHF